MAAVRSYTVLEFFKSVLISMERIHMGTLGNKLKEARKGKNMSQEEVSKRLLISRQSISKWKIMYVCRI